MKNKYPKFYAIDDIDKISTDIAYFTTPLEKGVSSDKDKYGVLIPLKSELNCILDIDLKTKDFSENFLNELLFLVKDIMNTNIQVDLNITEKHEDKGTATNATSVRTKLINLEYEKFKDIHSIDNLKKLITDF